MRATATVTTPTSTSDASIGFENGQFSQFQGYYTQSDSNVWTSANCHLQALIQTSGAFWGCITTPLSDSGFDAGTACIDTTAISHESSTEDCISTYGTSIPYCQKALRCRSFGDPSPLTQFYCGAQTDDFYLYLVTTSGSTASTSSTSTSTSTYLTATTQTPQPTAPISSTDGTANKITLGVGLGVGIPGFIATVVCAYYACRERSSSRLSRSLIAAWVRGTRSGE